MKYSELAQELRQRQIDRAHYLHKNFDMKEVDFVNNVKSKPDDKIIFEYISCLKCDKCHIDPSTLEDVISTISSSKEFFEKIDC